MFGVKPLAIRDFFDYFGNVHVIEKDGMITLSGINTSDFLMDVNTIWKNKRVPDNMFSKVTRYRLIFESFFVPDVLYQIEQIIIYKKHKSSKYRLKQAHEQLMEQTWIRSLTDPHEDILDFSQLDRLKFKLLPTQMETMQVYNTKVPQMQLKGFLLSTPPGCLTGDTEVYFNRGRGFAMSLKTAYENFNHLSRKNYHWDRSKPTYIRAYTNHCITLHAIDDIVYSGVQQVFKITLANGRSLKCTARHLIMTDAGFIPTYQILNHRVMCDNKRGTPSYSQVLALDYVGEQDTYDIVCQDPYHNFSANGMIVHNSGKTLMSIALSIMLHSDVTVFVVPKATVTTVWYDGIIEQFGPECKVWTSVMPVPIADDYDYYVFHYEALEQAIALAYRLRGDKEKPFIAIDESHNLNEITSQRTLRLIEVSKIFNCQHTVYATGTPVKALGLEMIPLLRTIDRFFTQEAEDRFRRIYGATAKRANDILRNRLGLISHKILEADYMTVPPPKEIDWPVKAPNSDRFMIKNIKLQMKKFMEDKYQFYRKNMSSYTKIYEQGIAFYEKTLRTATEREELRKYKDYVKKIIESYDPKEDGQIAKFVKDLENQKIIPSLPAGMKAEFKNSLSIVKYMKLRVLGESLGQLARIRGECAAEIGKHGRLDEIVVAADKKSIIFSSFIQALDATNKVFEDKGFKTLRVYGDLTPEITKTVNQFKQDPDANPLFGTLQSLAASQTLIIANVVIFLDAPFREYIRNQAFHRVFRIGQQVQTYIYMCYLDTGNEPNISTRSAEILEWSQQQVTAIFGSATKEEVQGIVKRLHLNPPTGMELLVDMMKKVLPF